MFGFVIDMLIISLVIIGGMAFMGTIINGLGNVLFGSNKGRFTDTDEATTTGWKRVGGK